MTDTPRGALAVLTCVLMAAFLVYFPGLSGGFIFDDAPNIERNGLVAITGLGFSDLKQAFFSSPLAFPSNRPLSMLSFGINHAVSGFNSFDYRLTNLLIHLLAGLFLFAWVRRLMFAFVAIRGLDIPPARIHWLGVVVAGAWLLHPINLTPALYVVQRMTSLAALFSFAALTCYVAGRMRIWEGRERSGAVLLACSLLIFGPLAFMSKENAALLPALMLVVEIILFRFAVRRPGGKNILYGFFVLTVGLPVVAFLAYFLFHPDWILGGYENRSFSPAERLMTEARVIWIYLRQILLPPVGGFGFFHDDIPVSLGLLGPPTTLLSLLGLLALIVVAVVARLRQPVMSFGILFFLVGHSMESTIIPLELAFEHRNYLPSVGPLLVLGYYLVCTPEGKWPRVGAGALVVFWISMLGLMTAERAAIWGDQARLYLSNAEHHPLSPRANLHAGLVYATWSREGKGKDSFVLADAYLERVLRLNPRNSQALFLLIELEMDAGYPVNDSRLAELRDRLERDPFRTENINLSQMANFVLRSPSEGAVLAPEKIKGLVEAALRNPRLSAGARARLYSMLGDYQLKVLEKPDKAIGYAELAVSTHPDVWVYRRKWVELLIELNQFHEAREQLREAKEWDLGKTRQSAIADLELQLQM